MIMRDKGCMWSTVGYYLVIIGGVNWGLVGLGDLMDRNLNVVHMLLGSWPMVEAAVYLLVGVAAVMTFVGCRCSVCKACRADAGAK
jgi:uncharacterized membrane protein YuzA (DUF378 family)